MVILAIFQNVLQKQIERSTDSNSRSPLPHRYDRRKSNENNMRLISATRKIMTKHLYNKLDVVNAGPDSHPLAIVALSL